MDYQAPPLASAIPKTASGLVDSPPLTPPLPSIYAVHTLPAHQELPPLSTPFTNPHNTKTDNSNANPIHNINNNNTATQNTTTNTTQNNAMADTASPRWHGRLSFPDEITPMASSDGEHDPERGGPSDKDADLLDSDDGESHTEIPFVTDAHDFNQYRRRKRGLPEAKNNVVYRVVTMEMAGWEIEEVSDLDSKAASVPDPHHQQVPVFRPVSFEYAETETDAGGQAASPDLDADLFLHLENLRCSTTSTTAQDPALPDRFGRRLSYTNSPFSRPSKPTPAVVENHAPSSSRPQFIPVVEEDDDDDVDDVASSGAGDAENDDEFVEDEAELRFLRRQQYIKRIRRIARGSSITKRTVSDRGEEVAAADGGGDETDGSFRLPGGACDRRTRRRIGEWRNNILFSTSWREHENIAELDEPVEAMDTDHDHNRVGGSGGRRVFDDDDDDVDPMDTSQPHKNPWVESTVQDPAAASHANRVRDRPWRRTRSRPFSVDLPFFEVFEIDSD